jgi:metal-sulfur cluster biosynthetic enzyme
VNVRTRQRIGTETPPSITVGESPQPRPDVDIDRLWTQLSKVMDPCSFAFGSPISIVNLGLIDALEISGTKVTLRLLLTMPACLMFGDIASQAQAALLEVDGVDEVDVKLEDRFEWSESRMSADTQRQMAERRGAYRQLHQITPRGRGRDVDK